MLPITAAPLDIQAEALVRAVGTTDGAGICFAGIKHRYPRPRDTTSNARLRYLQLGTGPSRRRFTTTGAGTDTILCAVHTRYTGTAQCFLSNAPHPAA